MVIQPLTTRWSKRGSIYEQGTKICNLPHINHIHSVIAKTFWLIDMDIGPCRIAHNGAL